MLIYYCYDAILPPSHILKLKPFARNFLFIFSKAFVTIFVIVYAQFLIPYQNDAKTRLRQKYPSVPSYMLTNDALIIDDPTYSYVWLIATISIVVVIEVVLMIAMTTYCFYCMSRGNGHHCQKTLAIRRKFLISIVMQMLTHLIVLLVPALILMYCACMKISSQDVTDWCIFLITIHGSVGVLTMLLSNKYYRSELIVIIMKPRCIYGRHATKVVKLEESTRSDTRAVIKNNSWHK
ncbi:hypothetical protein Y032_0030g2233 [Ancylostoma ceylanicum]|nr:hypothetical protein Y032_0030g2233 [Ancylostoma ceylanicum]